MTHREKARRLLDLAADHIETHGLLWNEWMDPRYNDHLIDTGERLVGCCCLVGTIRFVAGGHPDESLLGADVEEAIDMVNQLTYAERRDMSDDEDEHMTDLMGWQDYYADTEIKGDRLVRHDKGDRAHVVALLREAAKPPAPLTFN